MKLLIDAELYLFRAAAAAEYEAEWAPDEWTYLCRHGDAKAGFQGIISDLMAIAPDHQPVMVFGGTASFRYGVYPGYKANRKTHRKPAGYRDLAEWVQTAGPGMGWESAALPEVEGDDALALLAEPWDVIASDDKDMLTVPGSLLRNGELLFVTKQAADRQWMIQTLTGDKADGYPGCQGIGAVKAEKALEGLRTVGLMWEKVVATFKNAGHSEVFALQMARCARILRPGEYDHDLGVPRLWVPE